MVKSTENIEEIIIEIMSIDGPDGHTDGSSVITKFIQALLSGYEDEWITEYRLKNNIIW